MTVIAIPTNNTNTFSEVAGRTQNAAYVKYVQMCGFTPILVPMEANPADIVKIADGLLLAGGIDIDPVYYGYSNQASSAVDPRKDAHERALLYAFVGKGKRVFGICRGMQLIFREMLHELETVRSPEEKYFDYLENIHGHGQSALNIQRSVPSHYVQANMGGLLSLGKNTPPEKLAVNSMHHQACIFHHGSLAMDVFSGTVMKDKSKIGPIPEPVVTNVKIPVGTFQALAWSLRGIEAPKNKNAMGEYSSVLEAFRIYNDTGCNVLAVQWHPEELRTVDLLKNFFTVKASKPVTVAAK